jgi:hypothetical protein
MATTNQMGTAQEAGRPQPQTTIESSGGGPFIRHSQRGRAPQYSVSGTAFGGIVTQPLVARPGYFAALRVTLAATGGVNGSVTVAAAADAPYSSVALVTLKDAFGTPLIVAPGYEAFNLVSIYGGGFGINNGSNFPANLPSYSATSTGAAGTGNFSFSTNLPFEFSKGYGLLSAANASLLPTLQFNYAASSSVYSTAPGTLPTLNTTVDSDFYWLPEGVAVEPPGLGTTRQWILQQLNPTVASSASARLQFPRLGGYLDTIIMESRDSTGARVDILNTSARLQFYVDGVPLLDSTVSELYDDMAIQFGYSSGLSSTVRPTGTFAISRKTSLSQQSLGTLDSGEVFLSTNPGTLLEINQSPWASITNAPATVSALVGQVVPTGALIQGLPEL